MNGTTSSQVQNSSETRQNKRNEPKTLTVSKRIFTCRNSLLTDLKEKNPHIRSVYSLLYVAWIFLFVHQCLFYLAEPSLMWEDFDVLQFAVSKFSFCVKIWIMLHLLAFIFYEGLKLWITIRNRISSNVIDKIFLLLYIATFFSTLFGGAVLMIKEGMGPVSAFAIACEQVRIYMKIHSFVREKITHVLQYKPENDENRQIILYPTRKHYLYYLFAPTLIYRDYYPRSENRHWGKVLHPFVEMLLMTFVAYCIFMRFYKELFKNKVLKPFTKKETVLFSAASIFTGSSCILMMNYGMTHAWENFMAEFLRFGDREFYQDWWNMSSPMHFYRKWNLIVHEWLHAYIYEDLKRLGGSRRFSLNVAFAISAVFHDFVLCIALGFFYPVLTMGHFGAYFILSLIPFTKKRLRNFWFPFFIGAGAIVNAYMVEYYARVNCPKRETAFDFFKPRSWESSCQIFDFSFF